MSIVKAIKNFFSIKPVPAGPHPLDGPLRVQEERIQAAAAVPVQPATPPADVQKAWPFPTATPEVAAVPVKKPRKPRTPAAPKAPAAVKATKKN